MTDPGPSGASPQQATPARRFPFQGNTGCGCLLLLAIIALLVVVSIANAPRVPDFRPARTAQSSNLDNHPVPISGEAVKLLIGRYFDFRDPASVVFSEATTRQYNGLPIFCGRVNGRNGFGGMTGPIDFIFVAGAIEMSDRTPDRRWRADWQRYCVGPLPNRPVPPPATAPPPK